MLPLIITLLAACPKGYEPIDDACVVRPEKPKGVVVYFHGMLPAKTDWSSVPELKVLGAEAKRRSQLLVAMRGEQGLCLWGGADVREHFCWPSDRSQLPDVGRTLVRVGEVLGKVVPPGLSAPVYAGFSNGGFFTSLVMTEARADVKAYVLMHAGNVTGQTFTAERARPTLLIGASRDAYQLPSMRRLQGLLEDAGWQPTWVLREGVHEVTAADAKALFDFVAGLPP